MENTQTSPKPFVFVLMPFSKEFNDIYEFGIKAACEEAGMYCERVDEQQFDGTVLDRIYNQIATSSLIIADMTGRNPNVFYEVGYAHALNKRVILLTQEAEDIPFDLKHYPHIVYQSSISSLKDELTKRLKWAIDQTDKAKEYFKTNIIPYIADVPLIDNPTFDLPKRVKDLSKRTTDLPGRTNLNVRYELNFQNTTKKSIQMAMFRIGIISPKSSPLEGLGAFNEDELGRTKDLRVDKYYPDNQNNLWVINHEINLLPGAWERIYMEIYYKGDILGEFNCCIQLFTETGPHDFPFKLVIK